MPEYLVSWTCDLEGDTPEEAALAAATMLKESSFEQIYELILHGGTGETIRVDLEEEWENPEEEEDGHA